MKSEESDGIAARAEISWLVEVCRGGDVCAAQGFGITWGENDSSDGWDACNDYAGFKRAIEKNKKQERIANKTEQVFAFIAKYNGVTFILFLGLAPSSHIMSVIFSASDSCLIIQIQ